MIFFSEFSGNFFLVFKTPFPMVYKFKYFALKNIYNLLNFLSKTLIYGSSFLATFPRYLLLQFRHGKDPRAQCVRKKSIFCVPKLYTQGHKKAAFWKCHELTICYFQRLLFVSFPRYKSTSVHYVYIGQKRHSFWSGPFQDD